MKETKSVVTLDNMLIQDFYPEILYKYMDAKGGLSMLETEHLWFTRALALNDPYDCHHPGPVVADYGDFSVEIDVNDVCKYTGVCSLTDQYADYEMWTYYNGHKGMCVALHMDVVSEIFGFSASNRRFVLLRKVIYQEQPPRLNSFDIVPHNFRENPNSDEQFYRAQNAISTFLSTKIKNFEKEREYRLILRDQALPNDNPAVVRIPNMIDSVFLGCKFEGDPYEVIRLALTKGFDVYKFKMKTNEYGLEPELLYSYL